MADPGFVRGTRPSDDRRSLTKGFSHVVRYDSDPRLALGAAMVDSLFAGDSDATRIGRLAAGSCCAGPGPPTRPD